MSAVVPSGCASGETEPSGFIAIEPDRVPPTSATLTVKPAAGLAAFAKTGRAAPDRGAIVTSRVVWEEVWRNEACPPGGCVTVRRKVRWLAVRFWSVTTKDLWSVGESGLTFCGEPTTSPSEIRLL